MTNLQLFEKFWDTEVKPLADKCAEGANLIGELEKATTEAEKEEIKKQMRQHNKKDWYSIWYISQMIFYVEHDLADGRNPGVRMLQVQRTLNSEDYYKNVFKGEMCEEAKNYQALGQKLNKALELL